MNLRRSARIGLLVVVASLLGLYISSSGYYLPQATLRFVDDRNQPVENANVLVTWSLRNSLSGGFTQLLRIYGARTDRSGELVIPEWGPRVAFNGTLAWNEPHLYVFKDGYFPIFDQNATPKNDYATQHVVRLKWSGSPQVLRRADSDTLDYAMAVQNTAISLTFLNGQDVCEVRDAIDVVTELHVAAERLYPKFDLPYAGYFTLADGSGCKN